MKYLAVLLLCGAAFGQQKPGPLTFSLWCDGNTGKMRFDALPKDFKQGNKMCHVNGATNAETLDVPAIMGTKKTCLKYGVVNSIYGASCDDWGTKSAWTCADKSRILEHDESQPSHWWCRKVQP